jgi:hypothetical protein
MDRHHQQVDVAGVGEIDDCLCRIAAFGNPLDAQVREFLCQQAVEFCFEFADTSSGSIMKGPLLAASANGCTTLITVIFAPKRFAVARTNGTA